MGTFNYVVAGVVALATIVIAWTTVINMRINKTIKEIMKTTTKITTLLQEVSLEYTLYKYGAEYGSAGASKEEVAQKINELLSNFNFIRSKGLTTNGRIVLRTEGGVEPIIPILKEAGMEINYSEELLDQNQVL